jgi:hypothetical protein
MTCLDVQRVLPEVLDDPLDSPLPADLDAHVRSCEECSDLVADLKLISIEARQLEISEEPPARVWVRIAAELRAEGIIHDPLPLPGRPVLVPSSPRRRWSALWLAPVAAAILAASAYVVNHKTVPQVAVRQPSAATNAQVQAGLANTAVPSTAVPGNPLVVAKPAELVASRQPTPVDTPMVAAKDKREDEEAAPAAEDQQFLSVVSTRVPSMRATYENQLQAVNDDIRETQAYVDRNPGDADARQHLMDAYEQKALLYQMALDRIQ